MYLSGILKPLDIQLFKLIYLNHPNYIIDSLMVLASEFGRGVFWSGVIVSLWFFGNKKSKKTALLLLIVFVILIFVNVFAKAIYYKPRPSMELVSVTTLLPEKTSSSFPSGHTLIVVAGAIISWFRLKRIIALLLILESSLVAYSRIYLGFHYPFEIFTSILISASITFIILSQTEKFEPLFNSIISLWDKIVKKIPAKFETILESHHDYKVAILAIILFCGILIIDLIEDIATQGKSLLLPHLTDIIIFVSRSIPNTIQELGYFGVFILMVLEAASLPIPSEVVLPFSGYLVSVNVFDFWIVILVSTIAAIIGSIIDYYIGYVFGIAFVPKFGKYFLIRERHVKIAENWFKTHGSKAVFLCRLIPGVRTLISIVAGIAKMNLIKFLIYTTLGCIIWNILLVYLGFYLGSHWYEIVSISEYLLTSLIIIAIIFVIALVLHKRKRQRSR